MYSAHQSIMASKAIKITTSPLTMQCHSSPAQLSVPLVDSHARGVSSTDDYQTLLPWHMAFRANATHITDEKKARAKASAELQAIQITFPNLRKPATILAMSAMLFVNCVQDDWLEQLEPTVAEATMRHCIDIMRSGSIGQRRRPSQAANDELFKQLDDLSQNIVKVWSTFQSYLKTLLPAQMDYDLVSNEIAVSMVGFIDEAWFKAKKNTSVDEYLRIRYLTIGTTPFFCLLRVDMDMHNILSAASIQLHQLVGSIVGMQNDLIGMDKDLRTQEWMNFALVLAAAQDLSPAEAMEQTVATTNILVSRAVSLYESIAAGPSSVMTPLAEEAYAREILAFVERHLKWATIAKRYKK